MTTYYFHVDNGTFFPGTEGVDLPDLDAARLEAVRAAGEMIIDSGQSFWEHMTPWIMNVTDDRYRLLFTLQFAAKVPSGESSTSLGGIDRQKKARRPQSAARHVGQQYDDALPGGEAPTRASCALFLEAWP